MYIYNTPAVLSNKMFLRCHLCLTSQTLSEIMFVWCLHVTAPGCSFNGGGKNIPGEKFETKLKEGITFCLQYPVVSAVGAVPHGFDFYNTVALDNLFKNNELVTSNCHKTYCSLSTQNIYICNIRS